MTDSIIPFFEDASPDTELQRRVRQSQRLRVWRSLSDSYGKDPSKPTEAFNANLGPFVDDYIAQQERMRQDLVRATKRTESSPATSEWIANPDYARMSWDDVDSLAATESGISKAFVGAGRIVGKTLGVAEDIGASFVGGTVDLAGNLLSVAGALPEQAIELFRTAGYSPPAFRKMFLEDLARQGMTSREIARIEQQITPQTQEEFIQEGGFFPTVSGIARGVKEAGFALTTLSQQAVTPLRTPLKDLLGVDGIDPQSTYGAALSGIRSLPPMLAVAPLYPVLGVHGAGAAFVVPVYGQALLQAEQKGLSGQAAHTYALGSAGVEYLTNIVPGGKFLAGMKLKSPLLQRIKDQLPAELVQENIATATQDLLDMAVLEPEKTLEEYLRERPEKAWHTIVATTVGVGALNTTVRVAERMAGRLDQQQAATQVGGDVLQALIEGLRNSKVQQRSPKAAALFANMALEKQGADVARIDSEVLQQILTESGVGNEFLQEFPGIAEQLNQNGTDPGTEVELSSGEFAAQMALNERYADIAERMRPNLRLGASEFSLAEESQIEAERQRIRQDMDSLAQQQVQDAEENANQRQAILKELTDFAVQMPGINKKKAAAQAEVAVSMWSNLAKANNMKVGELWDLMKPVLAAGDITIPEMTGGGILFQGVTPEQDAAYIDAVESGDIDTVEDMESGPARAAGYVVGPVYHGTGPEFDVFDQSQIRRSGFGPGFHFAGKSLAQKYADQWAKPWDPSKHVEPRIVKAYLRKFENPAPQSVVRDVLQNTATAEEAISSLKSMGYDGAIYRHVKYEGIPEEDLVTYVAFDSNQIKRIGGGRDADGNVIPLSQRFDVTQPSILYAPEADAGRRGAYEPRPMRIILTQKADATTLIHEFTHHYLHSLSILAHNKDAPEAITTQFQTLLDWFGVADVAAWDALPADQKAVHHEAFTYNFEQFIGTGKAPTKRLRDVFKRVAAWMRKIYGDIRGELNAAYRKEFGKDLPALTPEVREVFEAMLGAESGTAEAAAELGFSPVFQSQEESGMNDEEWEAYNLGAELVIDEATSTLTASTARAMRWLDGAMARVIRAKTKQAKKERKAIRDRIKAEVEQQPVYRVMNMLRRGVVIEEDGTERKVEGQHRLNADAVKQMFPADTKDPGYLDLSSLRAGRYGMIAKDGIDPAVVADQFGYDSAAQMIRDLVAARPINDVINERTNKEIEKRHPELSPAAIKQAAMESLHNEAMSKFVATELRFLAGIQKPTRIVVEAARREAEAKIATLGYKSLTPSKFLAAERRAARTADQWMRSGDRRATIEQQRSLTEARKVLREAQATGDEAAIADAQLNVQQAQLVLQQAREELAQEPGRATVDAIIRAKWNQLYQGMLYREAVAARKRFEKHQRYLRRIAKDSKRKKILPEYADQIDYILRRLNISGVSRATSEQMSADRAKFLSWLEEQTNQNIEYSMSEGDLNLLAQRPIEDIPMESLDAIVDTIESIYHRGFVIRNGVVMQQKKRIRELQEENVSEVNQHAGKERPRNTTPATVLGRVQKSLYTFFNQHIKTAARARVIGGGKHGVFWNTFIRPANRQAAEEQQVIADLSQRLEGILQPFYERGAGTIDSGKTMARRKFNKSSGAWENDPTRPPRSLTHEEVFVLALNLGNESNIQRVVDGFGITIEEAREITSSLSAGELRAVQQIWDLFAELKPKISAMERRLYGKEPKWLTPAPIALQSNDGTTVELSGGYFPIKYDRSASELGIKIEAANEARTQLQGAFMGTQTRDSYKKTRADRVFGKPLLLQTSTLFNGLTEIVHDLSWREYIVDFNLLMPSDGAIPQAIIDRYGAEWMQDIRQWVKDIAAAGPGPVHPSEAWMQALRRSISISRLGFSPITGLLQQTGTVIAVEHVGAKHVADAVAKFMGDMRGSYTEMLDKSPAMRNRFRTQFRELGEQAARIRGKTTAVMQFERAAYSMILHSQMIPDTITWHAAYSRAFEDNPNISEQEAADRAYQAVLDTQGSGDITNLSTIERGGPASKLLTVFYTWQNTLFNELYVIAKTEGLSEKGAFQLAMLAIALPFLTVAIRDIAPDDEEERRKRLTGKGSMSVAEQYLWATLKESINTLGGSMVGVREVIPTIASVLSGERAFEYRGPAGFAPMTDFIGAVRAGAESGIMSKRFAKQSMYFLGDIGGLPSTQINRMVDGIDAMVEGKDVPWWAVVLGTQK